MDTIQPIGRFLVRASDYLKLDSDVLNGGGTDETAQLQAILDKALEWGGLTLILDGAALVSGVNVHSNTTIQCLNPNCGLYLKDGSNRAILQTAVLDFETIRTENIALIGGTYNLNCMHQERTDGTPENWSTDTESQHASVLRAVMGMKFFGVRGLTLRDMRTIDQRIYAMVFANWEHVVIENVAIELPHNLYAQNQDGLHFHGPGRDLMIHNVRGCAGDDFIALTPDENDGVSSITDVVIDGVYLEDADQGIRMLSRDQGTLDRVYVRNVYGTYKSCGFFINPWFGKGAGDHEGNYGSITIENVDLRQTVHKYAAYSTPFLFRLGGRIQSMTLKGIRAVNPNDARPLIEVSHIYGHWDRPDSCVDIGCLTIDGVEIINRSGTTEPTEYITVDGKVDNLTVRNVLVDRQGHPAPDKVLALHDKARVGRLMISQMVADGVGEGVALLGGTVGRTFASEVYVNPEE